MTIGCVIVCVEKVLPFGVLLLKGWDGQIWKDHERNCAPCGWPSGSIIGHRSNRFVMYVIWRIMRCSNHVVCDHCFIGWHMGCLTPPLMKVIVGDWVCP